MSITTIKLDNGEEFKFDSASYEFQAYEAAAKQVGVFKNDESFFFARNLEFIRQQVYTPVYSELLLLNGGLLSVNSSIPEGAETDSYDIFDATGEAEVISDFGDDIKAIGVNGRQVTNGIKSIGSFYNYSVQDLRRDRMLGDSSRSTVTNKALAARRSVDEKLEKMFGFGDTNYGITGLFNNADVPEAVVAATGTGATTTWSTKTPANILADITTARLAMSDLTNGTEVADTMIVSPGSYQLMMDTALDVTNYSGMTILKYVEQNYGLKVVKMQQIKNGFVNGTKSGFVLYKNSAEKLEGVMPIRLVAHAPQVKNLTTKNILEARCGGVRVFYPYSVSINTGI